MPDESIEHLAATLKWELHQFMASIDSYTKEVEVRATDEHGNEYSASAIYCCGEIENVTDVEKI
ncbi:hypothetical protein F0L74_09950 [Chitinophaga agrisoli]|uniref:Uncharacterized protein n=1 Tax=Chitinophaga agrisoli TaxID=2607653 RepID=A0A5B2VUD5_9BACT|nr:hypothetical protein [Chitinophaga agrisoli]KAA2242841.1 hypothetical protein F0L74_09950 [Chitinophaga agrisoli]